MKIGREFVIGVTAGLAIAILAALGSRGVDMKMTAAEQVLDDHPVQVKVVNHKNVGSFMTEYCIVERTDTHQRYMIEGDFGKEGEVFTVDPGLLEDNS